MNPLTPVAVSNRIRPSDPLEVKRGEEPVMVEFNINDCVYVKLTPKGKEILLEKGIPSEESDGYSEFKLCDLISIFGKDFHHGIEIPFEPYVKFFQEDLLTICEEETETEPQKSLRDEANEELLRICEKSREQSVTTSQDQSNKISKVFPKIPPLENLNLRDMLLTLLESCEKDNRYYELKERIEKIPMNLGSDFSLEKEKSH